METPHSYNPRLKSTVNKIDKKVIVRIKSRPQEQQNKRHAS